ncbi:bifunctional DNA-formamidopyrimidine glycosylase/DNA-(apurinic or apyrimidinic site) lyase [Amorphus orientalis]|uniref:Formamidopyrimidine-DNA glycosylase n=1 Tax=Amorphus orientalis TaxID=649198 RepID=A0AAE3VMU9_9HYPH|nr:bifunctional DNA-formamidopyrimidine glycosylase/DNA-(apurinic or apyrimidinic site) lyase [Amorphus orientalis]MDQ0314650.1 formamidopyrimidine-DNA glycosylase [Amorphus orientalis]
MPELPEVETVRRGIAPALVGHTIVSVAQRRPDLRFPFPERFVARVSGRIVTALGRRAKYLVADLDDGTVLLMHLGMSGSFRIEAGAETEVAGRFHLPRSKDRAHDHVEFRLEDGTRIVYNDPRRFGYMALIARAEFDRHPLIRGLGVEPVGEELTGAFLAEKFAGRSTSLKAALLDQRLIAGLGNIYVCEALWRARLSPRRSAGSIARKDGTPTLRAERLAEAVKAVIADAIVAGGSTLRDYMKADGSLGYFQHTFAVYDREHEPCRRESCRGTIRRIVQSGRSTFFCPECQR